MRCLENPWSCWVSLLQKPYMCLSFLGPCPVLYNKLPWWLSKGACTDWTLCSLELRPGPHRLWWKAGWEEAVGAWCFTGEFKKGAGKCALRSPPPWLTGSVSETH